MGKSVIYANNSATQTVATGGMVNFGSVVRRYGCNLKLSGGNVIIEGNGYYDADINLTLTALAGTVNVQIYKDGVPVQGAEATLATVADTTYSLTIPAIIRDTCCCESTIMVVVTGVTATITNASISVQKV